MMIRIYNNIKSEKELEELKDVITSSCYNNDIELWDYPPTELNYISECMIDDDTTSDCYVLLYGRLYELGKYEDIKDILEKFDM